MSHKHFGEKLKVWFTQETFYEAAHRTYDWVSFIILDDHDGNNEDVDLLEAFGHYVTEASCNQIIANGRILVPSTIEFDSDTSLDNNDSEEEKPKFILLNKFNYTLENAS